MHVSFLLENLSGKNGRKNAKQHGLASARLRISGTLMMFCGLPSVFPYGLWSKKETAAQSRPVEVGFCL